MSQQHFVGLDVSVKETAICVIDPQGRVVHRACVESDPKVIREHLLGLTLAYGQTGLEAGPLSPWLYAGLVEAGLPAGCVETRHMHAARIIASRVVPVSPPPTTGVDHASMQH